MHKITIKHTILRKTTICRKADADPKYKPFCSRRCSDVDLQRWFTGAYAINPINGK